MKNVALIGALILAIAVFLGGHLINSAPQKVFRVGSECNYPINNWTENVKTDTNILLANKKDLFAEGFDIQVAKFVADKMDAELEVYQFEWNELIPALNEGKIDAIFSAILDTNDRRKLIAFSNPYKSFHIFYIY